MTLGILTGGRAYNWDRSDVLWLAEACMAYQIDTLLHGACPTGADQIAGHLFSQALLQEQAPQLTTIQAVPARWHAYGRRAGPLRNAEMARRGGPGDYCLYFPGGVGTNNMKKHAQARGMTLIAAHTRPWLTQAVTP